MALWHRGEDRVRLLGPHDAPAALALCLRDPVGAVLAGVQVEALAAGHRPAGATLLGVLDTEHRLSGLCWAGANVVPVALDEAGLEAVARHLRAAGRRCSSIVGPAEQVLGLWERLRDAWRRPREIRAAQPSLVMTEDPALPGDPEVRPARPEELGIVLPASVAMFREEVGYDPLSAGGSYETRVADLLAHGRTFVRTEETDRGPHVVFKADVGALALGVAQIQGVWVHPERRGRGMSVAGMAAVVRQVRAHLAPTVSLYVNDYNAPALAAYRRVGFRRVGTYATVLF